MRPVDEDLSELEIPDFEADSIPIELASNWDKLPPHTQFLIKRTVVTEKKVEWQCQRLITGHRSIQKLKSDVSKLNSLRETLMSFKSIVVGIATIVLVPLIVAWFSAQWSKEKAEKFDKTEKHSEKASK
jgi:hypothetical protein